jgi:hypothetical protein
MAMMSVPSAAPRWLDKHRAAINLFAAEDGFFTWCEHGAEPPPQDAGVDAGSPLFFEDGRSFRGRIDGEPTPIPGCAAPGFDLGPAIASVAPTPGIGMYLPPAATMDATSVYFSPGSYGVPRPADTCDGIRVFALDKATGNVRTLADTGCNSVWAMAADDRDVYVVTVSGSFLNGAYRILRLPKAGGPAELVHTPNPYRLTSLAVDANALYWTGDFSRTGGTPGEIGVVVRVPKR